MKAQTFVDKTEWERGPWDNEPDKLQWVDEATNLDCLIVRGPFGQLCGYVGVTEGHRAFEQHYDSVEANVHGGLTYAGFCDEGDPHGICHVPEPGRPNHVWWFGFDCAHCDDYSPGISPRIRFIGRKIIYRTIDYVREEVTALAAQLAALSCDPIFESRPSPPPCSSPSSSNPRRSPANSPARSG